MDVIPASKLTEEYRLQELEKSNGSLFYFGVGICGLAAEDEDGNPTVGDIHRDLCSFLEGRHPHYSYYRALVCMARATAKSFWVRLYLLWRALNIVNLSSLIICNSAENAKQLHFSKLMALLTDSRRSEYIRWIYKHRFPPGLEGSNSERLKLIQTDPMADVALSYAGIETKLEGKHPDIVDVDDPEGADANKSSLINLQSWDLIQRVIPLFRYPTRSQLLVVCTPWGKKPVAYQIRESVNWRTQADNAHTNWKIFWKPILDENGNSIWEERFPKEYVLSVLAKDPVFDTQFMLRKGDNETSLFDLDQIIKAAYEWANPDKTAIRYRAFKFDPDKITSDGFVMPEPVEAFVPLSKLRFFIHFDPLHRMAHVRRSSIISVRPATAAIAVIGVAPDGHAFVLDTWVGDKDSFGQASELLRLYRLWPAAKITWESIGAQHWLFTLIQREESHNPNYSQPVSCGKINPGTPLPRMSHRLEEAAKTTESKDWMFREILAPWLNHGVLHIRLDHIQGKHELFKQLEGVMNESIPVDLVDCLAQGPAVWRASASDLAGRDFAARKRYVDSFVRRSPAVKRTGWSNPNWRRSN